MKYLLPAALLCLLIFVFFLLIQSPLFVNVFARLLGFNLSVGDISVSPVLSAEVRDLRLDGTANGGMSLSVSYAYIEGGISNSLQAEVTRASIQQPSLAIALSEKEQKFNLSFLSKLPPVQFLEIVKGEVQFSTGEDGEIIQLKDINLTLRDFSPKKGGSVKFTCKVTIKHKNLEAVNDAGLCTGDFHFTRLTPEPAGRGAFKITINNAHFKTLQIQSLSVDVSLMINSGELIISALKPLSGSFIYKKDDKDIVLKDVQLMPYLSYSTKTRNINAAAKNGRIGGLGAFDLNIAAELKHDYHWKAFIKAPAVNIEKASEIFRTLLPEPYNKWSFQGAGALEISMEGDYRDKRIAGSGRLIIEFKEGGFSAPKGDLAGQGVGGRIIMGIEMPQQSERVSFDISSEISLGEFMWGAYYKDFLGQKAFFLSKGSFHSEALFDVDFSGRLNLGEGGEYSYDGGISPNGWKFNIRNENLSLRDFYSFFFRDYIKQDFPSLSTLNLDGKASLEINLNGKTDRLEGFGALIIDKGQFALGDGLSGSINLKLPFDFYYPDERQLSFISTDASRTGNLHIESLQTEYAKIEGLDIPLIFSRNAILISGDVLTPFSDIPLKLTHFKGERLLSADRFFSLGIIISGMEIDSFIEKIAGTKIPARFEAEFPSIFYQHGILNIEGEAITEIFGGRVHAKNIHGRKIFSRSRVLGGDITFEGISLKDLTNYIKLGKMSGIIRGSLMGFEVEYGQPSRFVLNIESVKTRGVDQSVSVDAIESFSIVGAGSQGIGTILKSGLNKFFKNYPYSKIGIICILENDVFTLRGNIHEGSREYLIRKAFLRGIDVVNQNPDNNISFKDMMERINRIFEKTRQS